MRKAIFAAGALLLLGALAGCAGVQSTEQTVLRYNRAFAQSRNEVLLLNILRAAAREPLQFSTMGTVSGSVGTEGEIEIPFTNIILGGADSISPTLTIGGGVNPNISIVPLGQKDFVSGLLTPVGLDDIQLFLHSGWDAEFLLPLIVGGVICADGRLLLNSGEYVDERGDTSQSAAFRQFFRDSARSFGIGPAARSEQVYLLNDADTLALLRQGVGEGRVIAGVEQAGDRRRVTVRSTAPAEISGMQIGSLCTALPESRLGVGDRDQRVPVNVEVSGAVSMRSGNAAPAAGQREEKVIFRSAASVIHFLGESHRIRYRASTTDSSGLTYFNHNGVLQALFRIEWGAQPMRRAVETRFQDVDFWIPAIDLRTGERTDRTLKTLSFLDQLIALQTSADVVRGTQPLITVGQR